MDKACKRIQKFIIDYLDGSISEQDRTVLNAHLTWCLKCKRELQKMEQMKGLMKLYKVEEPSQQAWDNFVPEMIEKINAQKPFKTNILSLLGQPVFAWTAAGLAFIYILAVVGKSEYKPSDHTFLEIVQQNDQLSVPIVRLIDESITEQIFSYIDDTDKVAAAVFDGSEIASTILPETMTADIFEAEVIASGMVDKKQYEEDIMYNISDSGFDYYNMIAQRMISSALLDEFQELDINIYFNQGGEDYETM